MGPKKDKNAGSKSPNIELNQARSGVSERRTGGAGVAVAVAGTSQAAAVVDRGQAAAPTGYGLRSRGGTVARAVGPDGTQQNMQASRGVGNDLNVQSTRDRGDGDAVVAAVRPPMHGVQTAVAAAPATFEVASLGVALEALAVDVKARSQWRVNWHLLLCGSFGSFRPYKKIRLHELYST